MIAGKSLSLCPRISVGCVGWLYGAQGMVPVEPRSGKRRPVVATALGRNCPCALLWLRLPGEWTIFVTVVTLRHTQNLRWVWPGIRCVGIEAAVPGRQYRVSLEGSDSRTLVLLRRSRLPNILRFTPRCAGSSSKNLMRGQCSWPFHLGL